MTRMVWAATLAFCYLLPVHLFFKWLPGYFFAVAAYTAAAAWTRRKRPAHLVKGSQA